MNEFEQLPPYIICKDCTEKHFLSLNRCLDGRWAIGYVEYSEGTVIKGLALNNSDTIKEAALRMQSALLRYNRRERHVTN